MTDLCVLRLDEYGRVTKMIAVHVDGISSRAGKKFETSRCELLKQYVPVNDLGKLQWCTGCTFKCSKGTGTLEISQAACIAKSVERFDAASTRTIPACPTTKLRPRTEDEPKGDWPFRAAVGNLWCIRNVTRRDIAHAVWDVASYSHNPSLARCKVVLVIHQHLKGDS